MPQDEEKIERSAAQLAEVMIVRALVPFNSSTRHQIIRAVDHLNQADANTPGIFEAAARGMETK